MINLEQFVAMKLFFVVENHQFPSTFQLFVLEFQQFAVGILILIFQIVVAVMSYFPEKEFPFIRVFIEVPFIFVNFK